MVEFSDIEIILKHILTCFVCERNYSVLLENVYKIYYY